MEKGMENRMPISQLAKADGTKMDRLFQCALMVGSSSFDCIIFC